MTTPQPPMESSPPVAAAFADRLESVLDGGGRAQGLVAGEVEDLRFEPWRNPSELLVRFAGLRRDGLRVPLVLLDTGISGGAVLDTVAGLRQLDGDLEIACRADSGDDDWQVCEALVAEGVLVVTAPVAGAGLLLHIRSLVARWFRRHSALAERHRADWSGSPAAPAIEGFHMDIVSGLTALDASTEGIAITDANGVFRYMNETHARLFGYAGPAELIGQSWRVLYQEDQQDLIEQSVLPLLRRRGDWHGRLAGCRKDGSLVPQEVRLTVAGDGGIVCLANDATAARVAERSAMESLASMKSYAEMKASFLATASHELRTPLASIALGTGLLRDGSAQLSEAERRGILEGVCAGVEQMTRLLDNLLISSKLQQSNMKATCEPAHLPALAEAAVAGLDVADRGRIRRTFDPEATEVAVDVNLVRQILRNLLANACAYSPAESEVELEIRQPPEAVAITVRDRGIGLPEDQRDRVFEGFFRARNVGGIGGTGLGLYIVKQCVEILGGEVGCANREGGGAEFVVRFPAVAAGAVRPVPNNPMNSIAPQP